MFLFRTYRAYKKLQFHTVTPCTQGYPELYSDGFCAHI